MRKLGVQCNPQPLFLGERRCHRGPRDSGKLNQADWAPFGLGGAAFLSGDGPSGAGEQFAASRRIVASIARMYIPRACRGNIPPVPYAACGRKLNLEQSLNTAQAGKSPSVRPFEAPCEPYRQAWANNPIQGNKHP